MWLIGLFAIVLWIPLIIVAFRIRILQPEIEAAVQTYRCVHERKRRLNGEFHMTLFPESNNGNQE
jgi:hypothetical protein